MGQHTFLAFDLGATSGRCYAGTLENGKLHMQELTRFPNAPVHKNSHYYWDMPSLLANLGNGFSASVAANLAPTSVGIDTWGVDFGLLNKAGDLVDLPYAYRDPHTNGMPEKFFEL
ncbi:MAG: rhamnulokinase, partial [Prevotellaceae bacterium]|nr:rhamnulokinase [Prevotellaceae bacterium]